jgi:ubiquitin-activating enzyme E1
VRCAKRAKEGGFAACVEMALEAFYDRYNLCIKDLQHQFPRDKTTADGRPFWAAPKRFPDALVYGNLTELGEDAEYAKLGIDWMYVVATANLLAASHGLVPQPMNGPKGTVPPPGAVSNDDGWNTFVAPESDWRTLQYVEALAGDDGLDEPMFVKSKVEIDSGEKAKDDGETKGDDGSSSGGAGGAGGAGGGNVDAADAGAEFEALLQELASIDVAGLKGAPADFEKDLDLNFHIDFIFAAANLRACNYGIRSADRHKCKMIAGKIIPAIATSTACATALVGIEMLKLLQGDKELGAFKSSTCNFAINTFQMSEPLGTSRRIHIKYYSV